MVADEDMLVCGSGCYESVGDPTTLMIGARLLQFFDVRTGDLLRSIPAHPSAILDIQMDDQYVYSASIDRSIGVWDKTTGQNVSTLYGHLKAIYQIQLYENILISAGKDRTIRFWDPKVKDQEYVIPLGPNEIGPAPVQLTYGVDTDGTTLKQSPDTNLRAGSRALKSVILAHSHSVRRFAASNGHLFSVSSCEQGCVWDIDTNMLIRQFKTVDDAITTTLLNNDLVVASSECIQHFDLRTSCNTPVRERKEAGGRHVTLDTCKLLLSDTKGFIRIWDWNLFRDVNSLRVAKHRSCYYYDPATEHLFTGGSDKIVKLFDFSTRPVVPESPPSDRKCQVM
jgi:WD40 repeat protein